VWRTEPQHTMDQLQDRWLTAILSSDTGPRLSMVMLMLLSERAAMTGRGSCATRRASAASCLA
jgi:hypothetical protein